MSKKVLILSMGKAGSTTVINALKSAGIEYGRIHWHNRHEVDTSQYDYFIAMAREPVARAISDYFESKAEVRTGIIHTLSFFDDIVKPATGVDILGPEMPFNTLYGWTVYTEYPKGTENDKERESKFIKKVLFIRVEDFSSQLDHALDCLLGYNNYKFTVGHHPKGDERFGLEYVQFKETFKLPASYLKVVAESRYCQRFGYAEAVMAWSE